MTYKIDTVKKSEHIDIADVWEASVRATHHFLKEEDITYFRKLILDEYLHSADLRCIRNSDKKIIGFLGVEKQNIDMLFIHPYVFGKGVGRSLIQYAFDFYKANKVDVNGDNAQAVGFYKHVGFKTISRSELDPTGKPYPILHMELEK